MFAYLDLRVWSTLSMIPGPAAKKPWHLGTKAHMGTYSESFPPGVMRLCLIILRGLSISITRKFSRLCRRANRERITVMDCLQCLAKEKVKRSSCTPGNIWGLFSLSKYSIPSSIPPSDLCAACFLLNSSLEISLKVILLCIFWPGQ